MLRVTTLYAASAAATAAYDTQYLTAAPGEVPGVWAGRQAVGLGLHGEVDATSLQTLLEGRDPHSGTPLGRSLVDLPDARVRTLAGFDATCSAPKSVSVLWALTQDSRLLEAHDVAVRAALEHLERFGSTTRIRPAGGRLHPDTGALSMAVFRQPRHVRMTRSCRRSHLGQGADVVGAVVGVGCPVLEARRRAGSWRP
jgi:conjugative relaxase-like TrwC/TraI family protein